MWRKEQDAVELVDVFLGTNWFFFFFFFLPEIRKGRNEGSSLSYHSEVRTLHPIHKSRRPEQPSGADGSGILGRGMGGSPLFGSREPQILRPPHKPWT